MADLWEIARYVEANPNNYVQRWRLAKKLYLAWEYRLALEHLQILKNEWDEKENVLRYLAATYYRLKRLTDSVDELKGALQIWPQSLGLYEQLARTLDIADRKDEAVEVWTEILARVPEHAYANRAIRAADVDRNKARPGESRPVGDDAGPSRRLDTALGEEPRRLETTYESTYETPPPGQPDIVCPQCGTRNSSGFLHCWRCHGNLSEAPLDPLVVSVPQSGEARRVNTRVILAGGVLALLFALDLFLTYIHLRPSGETAETGIVEVTLSDFVMRHFAGTHVGLGLLLLFGWPLLLNAALFLTATPQSSRAKQHFTGVTLAAFCYAVSWLPGVLLPIGLVLLLIAAFVMTRYFIGIPLQATILAWMVQVLGVATLSLTAVAATEGVDFVVELPLIARFESGPANEPTLAYTGVSPVEISLEWESSGSTWLDREAAAAGFSISAGLHERPLFVEIQDGGGRTRAFEKLTADELQFVFEPVEPREPYRLLITGREEGVALTIEIRSLLRLSEPGVGKSIE